MNCPLCKNTRYRNVRDFLVGVIANEVTKIEDYAFSNCQNLVNVSFPAVAEI